MHKMKLFKWATQCATASENLCTLPPRWHGCKKAAVPSGHLSGRRDPRRDWWTRARTPLVSVLPPSRRGQSPSHLSARSPGGPVPAGIRCFYGNHSHGQGVGESGGRTFRCVKSQGGHKVEITCHLLDAAFVTLIEDTWWVPAVKTKN